MTTAELTKLMKDSLLKFPEGARISYTIDDFLQLPRFDIVVTNDNVFYRELSPVIDGHQMIETVLTDTIEKLLARIRPSVTLAHTPKTSYNQS